MRGALTKAKCLMVRADLMDLSAERVRELWRC